MKRRLILLCAAALVLLCASIGAQATSVVESIPLSPETNFVDVRSTLVLKAELPPSDEGAVVTWTSSRPQYATVKKLNDDSCAVTGKKMGRTIITVKAGGKSGTRLIRVTAPKASSIKLNAKSVTLNPSGAYSTYTLRAATAPAYHSDSVVWAIKDDDPENAIVSIEPSEDGKTCLVTARSDGSEVQTCTVTATLAKGGKSAACKITVKKIPEKYVRVTANAVVPLHASRTLKAVVYPVNAFNQAVQWEVLRDPKKAVRLTDNRDGTAQIEGLNGGNAVIKVTAANGRYALCAVTVKLVRYASFSVTPSSKVLNIGTSFQVKTKQSPAYVSYPPVSYESSDTSVVTVDENGLVTGVSRGYAKITVTADKGRVSRSINVRVISDESIRVTVSAIGDVMLGGDPRKGKGSFDRFANLWGNGSNPGYFFAKIKSQLKGVVFANLEIPLIDTNGIANGSRSYIFRGKTAYARALSAGGIDAVDLDNNHIMDYGSKGYASTKAAVTSQGVGYFGRGSVYYTIRNGVKIGFVGFRPETISVAKMKSSVKAVKSRCDVAIASFHWGVQYRNAPTAQQIAYGRAAVQAGADLVVGHHSHVISGIELYKGKHIVYGLGTIVSAVTRPSDIDTFIYQHTFSVTGTSVSNLEAKIVPVKMTKANEKEQNDAQPYIAEGDAKRKIIDKIKKYSPNKNLSLFK